MVDLDIAISVLFAVGLIEVELADCTDGSVNLYGEPAVLRASLIGAVLAQTLTSLSVGDNLLIDLSMSDVVYLQRLLGDLLAPTGPALRRRPRGTRRSPCAIFVPIPGIRYLLVVLRTSVVYSAAAFHKSQPSSPASCVARIWAFTSAGSYAEM